MEIILIRHGDAERGGLAGDRARRLTPQGREALRQRLAALPERLAGRDLHLLWSPATRAAETAKIAREILAPAIEAGKIRLVKDEAADWIYEGYRREFVSAMETEAAEAELAEEAQPAVVVVGHQPMLSEWAEVLTDYPLPFRKGDVRAFAPKRPGSPYYALIWHLGEA